MSSYHHFTKLLLYAFTIHLSLIDEETAFFELLLKNNDIVFKHLVFV